MHWMRARCTVLAECICTSCCNKVASSSPSLFPSSFSTEVAFTRGPLVFPSSMPAENRNAYASFLFLVRRRDRFVERCWKHRRYAEAFHIRIFKYSTMHRFCWEYQAPLPPLYLSFSLSLSLSLSRSLLLFLYFRREHVYIRDRSQLRSLDILISQWSSRINYILYDVSW